MKDCSLEELVNRNLIHVDFISQLRQNGIYDYITHFEKESRYYQMLMEIGVDQSFINQLCTCIEEWCNSGFCEINSNRKALVGRSLLLDIPMTIELNGHRKRTRVLLVW